MPPSLSIVMPVLNEAPGLAAALRALQPLRLLGAELLVVDGGSTDGTRDVCDGQCDQLLQAQRGRAFQMNAAAKSARSSTLLFLHADTLLPSDALQQIQQALARPGAQWGRFEVRITGEAWMLRVVAWMMNRRSRWTGIATGDQAIFVRRAVFESIGGFPEQVLMEDVELSRRLGRVARPVCLLAKVSTSGRRWEQHGVWRTIFLMWWLRLAYWLGAPADHLAKLYR